MERTDVVVIGAGQAGLSASRCLADRGIEHVVLDRGRVAERWRSERSRSLHLLTPSSLVRLPGDAEGGESEAVVDFLPKEALVGRLERYAARNGAPVREGERVVRLRAFGSAYVVDTESCAYRCRGVVIATGYCDLPRVPAFARELGPDVFSISASRYVAPDALPPASVLVVGASASGVQIADELVRAGREVFLAAGRHTRLPRSYRGRDIYYWLDALGVLADPADETRDVARAARAPSPQLVGATRPREVDLPALVARGVRVFGHAVGASRRTIELADDLSRSARAADAKRRALLARIDAYVAARGESAMAPAEPIARDFSPPRGGRALDLRAAGIGAVVWATGHRRAYPWVELPIVDVRGELRQRGGVTPAPGVYTVGLAFQRRRDSSFLSGVGEDARAIVDHLAAHLAREAVAA